MITRWWASFTGEDASPCDWDVDDSLLSSSSFQVCVGGGGGGAASIQIVQHLTLQPRCPSLPLDRATQIR